MSRKCICLCSKQCFLFHPAIIFSVRVLMFIVLLPVVALICLSMTTHCTFCVCTRRNWKRILSVSLRALQCLYFSPLSTFAFLVSKYYLFVLVGSVLVVVVVFNVSFTSSTIGGFLLGSSLSALKGTYDLLTTINTNNNTLLSSWGVGRLEACRPPEEFLTPVFGNSECNNLHSQNMSPEDADKVRNLRNAFVSISAGLAFLRTPDGKDILEEAEHVWCKELRKEIWKGTLMPARTTFANMWESLEWAAQFSGLRNPADPVKTVTAVGQKLVAISFQSSMNHTMDCFVDELRRFWKFAKKHRWDLSVDFSLIRRSLFASDCRLLRYSLSFNESPLRTYVSKHGGRFFMEELASMAEVFDRTYMEEVFLCKPLSPGEYKWKALQSFLKSSGEQPVERKRTPCLSCCSWEPGAGADTRVGNDSQVDQGGDLEAPCEYRSMPLSSS